jgi:hypothetical protein
MVILRVALCVDGLIFLLAALLNFGVKVPLGFTNYYFPDPIWQAGIGEAVIGLTLLVAGITAVTGRTWIAWVAFWLSVAGIAFGLSSKRVQGPARDIHLILVPLALAVFGLLLWARQQRQQSLRLRKEALGHGGGK